MMERLFCNINEYTDKELIDKIGYIDWYTDGYIDGISEGYITPFDILTSWLI